MKKLGLVVISIIQSLAFSECRAQQSGAQNMLGKAIFEHSLHNYSEAKSLYDEALQQASNPQEQIAAFKGLGMLAMNQGKNEDAISNFKKAVDLESSLPSCSPAVRSATLSNLAVSYCHLSKYAEAEPLYTKALALAVESGTKQAEASVLDHMSMLYTKEGRFADADAASLKAVKLAETGFGADSVNTATIMANRGYTLGLQGRYREAELLLKNALAIDEKRLGVENNNVASVSADLAKVYLTQGRLKEAKALLSRSVETRRKLNGKDDPTAAGMESFLARAYLEDGEIEKARQIAENSLVSAEKTSGKNGQGLFFQLVTLGSVYERKGDISKAKEYAERALSISRTHKALLLMAKICMSRAEPANAEKYAREALNQCKSQFGPNHPEVAKCATELASILKSRKSLAESKELEKTAAEIRAKIAKLNGPK